MAKIVNNYDTLFGRYITNIIRSDPCSSCPYNNGACMNKTHKDYIGIFYNTVNFTPIEWKAGYRSKSRPNYLEFDLNNRCFHDGTVMIASSIKINNYPKLVEIIEYPIHKVIYTEKIGKDGGSSYLTLKFDEYRNLSFSISVKYTPIEKIDESLIYRGNCIES